MGKIDIKPTVKNRYKLKISDIKNLKIKDRSKICEPLFWRNEIVRFRYFVKKIVFMFDERWLT